MTFILSNQGGASWGGISGTLSNQSDLNTALSGKEPAITAGTSGQYLRGDKTWQTLDKTAVGLSSVANTDTTNPANITQSASYRFATDAEKTTWNGKQDAITNGFGLTGTTTRAVSLTTAEAFCTAETTLSAATYADITGASISLAAGTWLILATLNGSSQATTATTLMAAITDSANTVIAEGSQHIVAGTATVRTWGNVCLSVIISPGTTTTYKLRGARTTTTNTGNCIVSDGNGVNTANNVSNNTDKSTSIRAIRIA